MDESGRDKIFESGRGSEIEVTDWLKKSGLRGGTAVGLEQRGMKGGRKKRV